MTGRTAPSGPLTDADRAAFLELVAARAPLILFTMDARGTCTMSVGASLARLGLEQDELVGADVLALYADDPVAARGLRLALDGTPVTYAWVSVSGAHFQTWLEPVRDDAGQVVSVVGVCLDETDGWRAEEAERARARDQQDLLHQVVRVQDAERRRIWSGLHDDTVQVLAALALRLDLARRQARPTLPGLADDLGSLSGEVGRAGTRLRRMIADLEPQQLADQGLEAALETLLENTFTGTTTASRVLVSVDAAGLPPGPGPSRVLYEVAVEALANVRKHARAGSVQVHVDPLGGGWRLEVADDGVGLAPVAGGGSTYGLASMRRRAAAAGGSVELGAGPVGGTVVAVAVPSAVGYLHGTAPDVDVRTPIDHILESVTDAFVALDTEWHFVYVNRRAAEMFGRDAGAMIGRHIWTEFPEGVGHSFYHAYRQAVAEQRTVELEDYYPPWDRWLVNRIYPSPYGLTIFVHDVSEKHDQSRRLLERDLGGALLSEMLVALSADPDLTRALHAAVHRVVTLDGVRGMRITAAGADAAAGVLADDGWSQIAARHHRVFVGDVEVGAVVIAWDAGVDDGWARYLGSAAARTVATRLAPGNPAGSVPVGPA